MHEITFSTVDKPKLLSQVVNSDFILKVFLCFCKRFFKITLLFYFIQSLLCFLFYCIIQLLTW